MPSITRDAVRKAGLGNELAKREGGAARLFEHKLSGVRGAGKIHERRRCVGPDQKTSKPVAIDLAAFRVEIEKALSELHHLREAAGDGDARHGIALQVLQHPADEVAHVDECGLGKSEQLLYSRFGRRAGRPGDVRDPRCAGDVDPAMDRMNPGGARERHHDAGGSEDRQAADDAKTSVERFLREFLAVGNRDLDHDIAVRSVGDDALAHGLADHGARDRIDGGFARRYREARLGDRADTGPGAERDAGAGGASRYLGLDQGAMRDIRIIARVLDNAGSRGRIRTVEGRDRKRGSSPVGQDDLDHRRALAGDKQLVGRARCSRSAGAGRPAAPQGSRRRVGHRCIVFTQNRFPFNTAEI